MMIGKLKGIVDTIGDNYLIIDVGGVGYVVYCTNQSLGSVNQGEAISLIIETHVREDHIHLFGFANSAERDWFRELTTIKGVGVKMAMAILSVLSPSQLNAALAAQDNAAFSQVSGVGPKLASRIVTELKDKFGKIAVDSGVGASAVEVAGGTPASLQPPKDDAIADAVSALGNLGYSRTEAYQIIAKAAGGNPDASVEELVKAGLQELSR